MLTNNWRAHLKFLITGQLGECLAENGASMNYTGNFKVMKAEIGTGNSEAKATDYKLESELSSGYTANINIVSENSYLAESQLRIIVNITNTSKEQIAFSELGIFGNSYSTQATYGMLAREVFDTPITLGVGETKSFVLKLF